MTARMAFAVAVLQFALASQSASAQQADAESLFGPADLAAIAGNGRVTIGVNRSGRMTTCRWPSPGYFEQLTYATESRSEPLLGVDPGHGAGWALQLDDQLIWMHDDRWSHRIVPAFSSSVIEIDSRLNASDIRMRQRFTIGEDGNAFAARVTVSGTFDRPPIAYWYANFSPSTRLIPHLPINTSRLDDFAAFIEPDTNAICHFRPADPSGPAWRAARALEESGEASPDWTVFPGGTYIVYGTNNVVHGATVGPDEGRQSVANQVGAGSLSASIGATGQTASAIAIEMVEDDGSYSATTFAAFGTNYGEALQRFTAARGTSFDVTPESIFENESDARWVMRRAMLTIHTCTDAATGSVVQSPTNTPPLAIDWPRFGVWIALAHDAAGNYDAASRILTFYASHLRAQVNADAPRGTIAAGLYTNGIEATPEAMVDAAAVGRIIWAMQQHATRLAPDPMREFYQTVWDSVNEMADFLVQWREPGGRGPLYTFDYNSMRDRRTTELYVASYLGANAADKIANTQVAPRPDWQQAANELRSSLQRHVMRADGKLAIENPGLLYDTRLVPDGGALSWPDVIQRLLAQAGGRLDTAALEALCQSTLSARDIPQPLRDEIAAQLKRHLERERPDAAEAAFAYLIAHKLHTIETNPPTPIEGLSPDTP